MRNNKINVVGKHNQLRNLGYISNTLVSVLGHNNSIMIEHGVSLLNVEIRIKGNDHKLFIGKNVIMRAGSIVLEDCKNSIIISDKTTIESALIAATEVNKKIFIGKDCMISHDVELRTGDSHSIIDIATGKRINFGNDITLEDHVWVGAHCKILKGSYISKNSIIGIQSICTHNVISPNSIAIGTPSKVVKKGVTWKRPRIQE